MNYDYTGVYHFLDYVNELKYACECVPFHDKKYTHTVGSNQD